MKLENIQRELQSSFVLLQFVRLSVLHYTTLFINDKEQIEKKCLLKTINHTTNLAYSLDRYLWAISVLAAEKLQIRCVMETHVIAIKPSLQIVDMGNGCEAYSAIIYIPAKSELTTTLQSIT